MSANAAYFARKRWNADIERRRARAKNVKRLAAQPDSAEAVNTLRRLNDAEAKRERKAAKLRSKT